MTGTGVIDPDKSLIRIHEIPDAACSSYLDLPVIKDAAVHDPGGKLVPKAVVAWRGHGRRWIPPQGLPSR
jgi:hypothetical protein